MKGKMKKRFSVFGFFLIGFLVLGTFGAAWAADAKPAMSVDDIKNALGVSVYLQGGYTANLRGADTNDNRAFDFKGNSFTLDLMELQFLKAAPVGGVGFKIKLSAGTIAKIIHANGLGASSTNLAGPNNSDAFDLTEAYIDYVAPVGSGLTLQLGKFVTFTGEEVIEASGNYNYSRSFLFNYAIPFTHTGLMAGYAFSNAVSANVYVLNGWDNAEDNNTGKTFGASVTLAPAGNISTVWNILYGPEENNDNHDNRFLFDWVGSITPVKNLTLAVNTDYANEKNGAGVGVDSKWYGAAVYANYVFTDKVSGTIRVEELKDPQGVRITSGTPQNAKEVTLTTQYTLAKNLLLRPEYRHDWSNAASFVGGTRKQQDTLAMGVMYTW